MNMKSMIKLMCLFALSLQLVSCGSPLLSDEEFTEAARETCHTLMAEITSLNPFDITGKANEYRSAAGVLAEIEISEESAPQGFRLRTGLTELADAQESFADALANAMVKADMDTLVLMMPTEGGSVYGSASGSVLDMVKLDIENELVLEWIAKSTALEEAAVALGLEECAPERLDADE